MSAFTNFIIIGKLASTPEYGAIPSGVKKIKFRVRCELPDKITFLDVTAFGDYLAKSISMIDLDEEVSISGRIDSRLSDKGYLYLDLVARDVNKTSKKRSLSFASDKPRPQTQPPVVDQTVMFTSEDIPF